MTLHASISCESTVGRIAAVAATAVLNRASVPPVTAYPSELLRCESA